MYFTVLRISIRNGKSEREAKKEALDAITLRFHLSEKRTRMLIADYIRKDYDKFLGTFYVQNLRLIQTLEEMNKEKMEEVERNNKLISLLKEVNDEYAGKRR